MLLSEELRRAVVVQEADDRRETVQEALQRRSGRTEVPDDERAPETERRLAMPRPLSGPRFSTKILVRPSGLEPPREISPPGPSTSYTGARYVRRRPNRSCCAVSRTPRTHLDGRVLPRCCHDG